MDETPRVWLTPKWNAAAAREAADALLDSHPRRDKLVLLGAKVASAFLVDFRRHLCAPRFMPCGSGGLGRHVLVIPHPSGRSREWKEKPGRPPMALLVREAFRALQEAR